METCWPEIWIRRSGGKPRKFISSLLLIPIAHPYWITFSTGTLGFVIHFWGRLYCVGEGIARQLTVCLGEAMRQSFGVYKREKDHETYRDPWNDKSNGPPEGVGRPQKNDEKWWNMASAEVPPLQAKVLLASQQGTLPEAPSTWRESEKKRPTDAYSMWTLTRAIVSFNIVSIVHLEW